MDFDARDITEPDLNTENFVRPMWIDIRESEDFDESNGVACWSGVRSNGGQIRERVIMLVMFMVGLEFVDIVLC
jgi:hypothetical protein